MDKLKQFLEKWNKMDTRTKIIFGVIALILIVGLVISFSSMGGDKAVSNTDLGIFDDFVMLDAPSDTDGEGYDAAMSSTDADAGGEDYYEPSHSEEPAATTTTTTTTTTSTKKTTTTTKFAGASVSYGEDYNTRDEVAAYLTAYGELPPNYITKSEAQDWGWKSTYNTVAEAAPGMSIGGDRFGNYEEILPKGKGRQYYECDIDYKKGNRNAKRIVFSNDGLIFYTDDHYESFSKYDPETGEWIKKWK